MASEIEKLALPSLVIPGLFIPEKIVIPTHSRMNSVQATPGSAKNSANGEPGPPPGLPSPPPSLISASGNDGARTPESLAYEELPPYKPQHDNVETVKIEESPVRRGSPLSIGSPPTGCPTPPPEVQQQRVVLGKGSGGPVSYRNIVQNSVTPHPATGNDKDQRSQTKQIGNTSPVNVQQRQRRINPDMVRRARFYCITFPLFITCSYSLSTHTIPRLATCSILPRMVVNTVLTAALVMIIFWTRTIMKHYKETPRRFLVLWQTEVG